MKDRLYSLYDRRDKLNIEAKPPGFRSRWERLSNVEELVHFDHAASMLDICSHYNRRF